jgi:hypothetical protein
MPLIRAISILEHLAVKVKKVILAIFLSFAGKVKGYVECLFIIWTNSVKVYCI